MIIASYAHVCACMHICPPLPLSSRFTDFQKMCYEYYAF